MRPRDAIPGSVNAQEAGGWFNDIDGWPGVSNVLSNDTDVDLADNPSVDKLSVSRIGLGSTTTTDVGPIGNTTVVGAYGTLKINSNGNTTYVIDDDHPAVQALRLSGNTLTGRWTQSNGKGRLIFRFNADFSGFTGVWSYGDAAPARQWNGRR